MEAKILIEDTMKGRGKQTVMQTQSGVYVVVSSVSGFGADETFIFPSDKEGNIIDFGEIWGIRPKNHKAGIQAVCNGEVK